jgi:hypothetical protein
MRPGRKLVKLPMRARRPAFTVDLPLFSHVLKQVTGLFIAALVVSLAGCDDKAEPTQLGGAEFGSPALILGRRVRLSS